MVLVGNKKDQGGDRMVSSEDGLKRSRDIGCHAFHEISVRESIEEVSRVFSDAVRYWREVMRTPKLRRASSDLHDLPHESSKALQPPVSVPGSPVCGRPHAARAAARAAARRVSIRSRTHPVCPSMTSALSPAAKVTKVDPV